MESQFFASMEPSTPIEKKYSDECDRSAALNSQYRALHDRVIAIYCDLTMSFPDECAGVTVNHALETIERFIERSRKCK